MTLVEGLHLDGTFLMVDLHPQARILLVLVLFFHMICSLSIWWLSVELVNFATLASLGNAIRIALR